jgi:hypothetical protein
MATMVDRLDEARHLLEEALEEREVAQRRFEESIGTSMETGTYSRLRRATRQVASADRALREVAAEGHTLSYV